MSVTTATPILGPAAWRGEDLERTTDWIRPITDAEVYHARTTYEDDSAPGRDRFLMRLWLSMPNSRALPEGFEALWGRIEAGAPRGGIAQSNGGRA